ncbi:arabinose efflux permease family protein [Desulfosporosinus acidiphilus SJ4]|uniref:Arabinose efflux permease family protein n=1 Tax=Desulfosporosinus acidiphilus (strain DSM 22704 / JCM 16185 / SJ4) TaxID=646529 RepID=I4D2Z7_DESAJ|nr:MFS transporter [Desulfosporosinus acidiphilus]AFM40171.1 arabinose efflux permease family protein [Desulfosporosinus acidiphilus SJ4]
MNADRSTYSSNSSNLPVLSRSLLLILAVSCGLSVANLYYNQPLLADMAQTFHLSAAQIGSISMLTQLGYALGLFLFVPLGDIKEKKSLIVILLGAVTLSLLFVASSNNLTMLGAASFAVGTTTVVPQIIVPLAAQLAAPNQQGRIVGIVMSGLFFGILLARTISGIIGSIWGWRTMFYIAACLMLVLALMLWGVLPKTGSNSRLSYGQTLKSLGGYITQLPLLREASLMGGLLFGTFSVFWTTLAFFIKQPPYYYGTEIAGLFGLIGVAGASFAPIAGRLADKKGPRIVVGIAAAVTLLAYCIFWFLGQQLWGLILGVILLDLGIQSAQISNQARVYALIPEAKSRLNTIYMVSYFIGGSFGSFLGMHAWSLWQWKGVCLSGSLLILASLITWGIGRKNNINKNNINKDN